MKKIIMSAALVAAMIFTGCGGVDKAKLAQLTGDKSFEQVKAAYKTAVFYDKKEEVEIYKYYLTKNADKVAGFDFEMYSSKVNQDYLDMSKKLQEQLKKYQDNIDKVPYAQLKNELTMGAFAMGQAKPIDDYVKGIEALMKEKYEREKLARKAEKEAYEARERARPDYVEKVQIPRKNQNQEK